MSPSVPLKAYVLGYADMQTPDGTDFDDADCLTLTDALFCSLLPIYAQCSRGRVHLYHRGCGCEDC